MSQTKEKPRKRAKKLKQAPTRMHVIQDNIATPMAPVWRARIATPLTPRAVREQILSTLGDIGAAERQRWLARRRSPLDKMLTEDEAGVLERWTRNEELMSGRARTADFCGDRVQTSRCNVAPLHDEALGELHHHMIVRKSLDREALELLTVFTQQMSRDREVMSPAEAGLRFFPKAKNKSMAYYQALRDLAARLVAYKY
jgi:hypothetical protein